MSRLPIGQEYVFSQADYKFMKFNPIIADKSKSLLENFPQLARFKSFQDIATIYKSDHDKIVKYILLCYDQKSPAVEQISDLFRRKSWCGYSVDFEVENDTTIFKKRWYDILNCQVECVNLAIIDFCSMFNSTAYMSLVTGYEALYRKQRTMSEIVDDDKKDVLTLEKTRGELWKQIQNMQNDLRVLEQQYLNDKNSFLLEDLYRLINEQVYKALNLTPEKRAVKKGLLKDG